MIVSLVSATPLALILRPSLYSAGIAAHVGL